MNLHAIRLSILARVYFFCPIRAKYPFAKASNNHKLLSIIFYKKSQLSLLLK